MTVSALDGIAGLGETRRKALLARFGSVRKLRAADIDELVEVRGIGRSTAAAIVAAFARESPGAPAVNVSTGEILDDNTVERAVGASEEDVADAAEGPT
jgi:excinuclease ABC subunit C